MACVVRYSFLLIGIFLRSTSEADSMPQVTTLIGADGNEMIIQCATDKTQDGVYMYTQGASKTMQQVFYYYKDGTFTIKSPMYKDKVKVNGTFPNFNAIFSNVNATYSGFYWCEFNLEDKITFSTVTWLWIESADKKINKTGERQEKGGAEGKDGKKVCPEDIHPHVKIVLIVCAVMLLLCITGFIFVILKGCRGNKKYRPSNIPSDSVYEEMKRSNLDAHPSVRTFINPDYQSTKLLR